MTELFVRIVQMSVTAGWLSIAIMLLRPFLRKAPKWIRGILWGMVGLRLICPVSVESIFSLIPKTPTSPITVFENETTGIVLDLPMFEQSANSLAPNIGDSANPIQIIIFTASIVWVIGIAVMLIYTLISFLIIKNKVSESIVTEENIWASDKIATPFILGIIKPKIYLPIDINEADKEYVIAHERAHLKRGDHLWKPFGFLLLSVYWFNPILWVAYILLCRDIELACDEKVIAELGSDCKKPYSEALVNCSVSKRTISACPLAFGESGIKDRIKSVLSYKKAGIIITAVSLSIVIIMAIFFLTDPEGEEKNQSGNDVSEIQSSETKSFKTSNNVAVIGSSFGYNEQGHPYVFMEIKNNSEQSNLIFMGQDFYILDGEKVVVPSRTILYDSRKSTVKYHEYYDTDFDLQAYDLEDGKTYRIVANYKFDTYDEIYGAYVDFQFDSRKVSGTLLRSDVIYWEYDYKENYWESEIPLFLLGDDNKLYTRQYNGKKHIIKEWYEIGEPKEFKISKSDFKNISNGKWFISGESLDSIIKQNKTAIKYEKNDYEEYLILKQNDGTYFFVEKNGSINGINRIVRMTTAISEPLEVRKLCLTTIASKSGIETDNFIDNATMIGQYLKGDHWTEVDENNWVKFNPSIPNGKYLEVQFSDTSYMYIMLYFSNENDTAYASVCKAKGTNFHYTSFDESNYTRVILSDEFKNYIIDNILK